MKPKWTSLLKIAGQEKLIKEPGKCINRTE
jgi:hypothetical protein